MGKRLRVGDLVSVKRENKPPRLGMVASLQGWGLVTGVASIRYRNENLRHYEILSDCTIATYREFVNNWWKWL